MIQNGFLDTSFNNLSRDTYKSQHHRSQDSYWISKYRYIISVSLCVTDPGYFVRISDPTTTTKEEEGKKIFVSTFLVTTYFTKFKLIYLSTGTAQNLRQ
jgi:hypothetical protein